MFRGTFTALVTPFRDGGIDTSAFEKLIEAQIAAGITGVVAVGTTGESPTLSHEEREQVIRLAVAIANKRGQVLAGTGSNATHHAVADTKAAEKLGVDGALLVAPYYNKPSQEGLFRHFKMVADATSLPIMLYNIPGRCGVDIAPDTVARLAKECGNIVSIKEASGSVERVSELRARLPGSFTILKRRRFTDAAVHVGRRGWSRQRRFEFISGGNLRTRPRLPVRRCEIGGKSAPQIVSAFQRFVH